MLVLVTRFSISIHFKMLFTANLVISPRKDIGIDYTPHTVYFIPRTHLFCDWMFLPYNFPHLFSFLFLPLPLGNHLFFSVSISVLCLFICFVFQISHISEMIQYLSFSVWFISLGKIDPLGLSMLSQMARFHYFCAWVIFHCLYIPYLLYPFICLGALSIPPYLGYWKWCCNKKRGAEKFPITVFLFSSDKYPGVELLDHMVVLFLIFWGISFLFSTVAVQFLYWGIVYLQHHMFYVYSIMIHSF